MELAVAAVTSCSSVLVQAQQHQPPTRAQHPRAFRQRARRMLGVGQRVEQQYVVEDSRREGKCVNIGDLDARVLVAGQPLAGGSNGARVGVDAGERAAVRREHAAAAPSPEPTSSTSPRLNSAATPRASDCQVRPGE